MNSEICSLQIITKLSLPVGLRGAVVTDLALSLGAVSTWMGDSSGNTKPAHQRRAGVCLCPGTAHAVSDNRADGRLQSHLHPLKLSNTLCFMGTCS